MYDMQALQTFADFFTGQQKEHGERGEEWGS